MIRIGIVGCGRILNAHLLAYKALREVGVDNFRITALTARKENDALMFLQRGKGPPPRQSTVPPELGDPLGAPHTYLSDFQDDVKVDIYTNYQEMIEKGHVDAVNDFTTLAMHHQVGETALEAKKHLLTQKPLAISVKAGKRLVEMAKSSGLILGIVEVVRYDLYARALAWAVSRGLIGNPQLVVIGSLGGLWSPDRIVANTPWRHCKIQAGGGGSVDIGVHQFHLLRYVIGEISWISAVTSTLELQRHLKDENGNVIGSISPDVDDTYLAVASFENKAIAQLLWSWACRGKPLEIPGAPVIYGSKGCIKGKKLIYDNNRGEDLLKRFEKEMSPEEREQLFPFGLSDPFALQQLEWLRAIEEGREVETSGYEGLKDLACSFAMLESSNLGRRVTLKEVLTGRVSSYQAEIDSYYGL